MISAATQSHHARRAAIARSVGTPAPGSCAIPPPAPTPRVLPVLAEPVPPREVRSADDRMWCSRLDCTLKASACVERQLTANAERVFGRRVRSKEAVAVGLANTVAGCKRCPDGRRVAAKLGVAINEQETR